jgi:hypothetical protein
MLDHIGVACGMFATKRPTVIAQLTVTVVSAAMPIVM